ncbi:TPA: hypothetical protein DDW35_08060 [Candidatus Sumerlaeota bacterium]|nr:hypothetical protein [Candidatus Sumerlaeota bacterium]
MWNVVAFASEEKQAATSDATTSMSIATEIWGKVKPQYGGTAFQNYRAIFTRTRSGGDEWSYNIREHGENYIATNDTEHSEAFSWDGKLFINKKGPQFYLLEDRVTDVDLLQVLPRFLVVPTGFVDVSHPMGFDGKTLSLGFRDEITEKITFDNLTSLTFSQVEMIHHNQVIRTSTFKNWRNFSGKVLPSHITMWTGPAGSKWVETLTLIDFQDNPDDLEDYVLPIPYEKEVCIQDDSFTPPLVTGVMALDKKLMQEKKYREATAKLFAERAAKKKDGK